MITYLPTKICSLQFALCSTAFFALFSGLAIISKTASIENGKPCKSRLPAVFRSLKLLGGEIYLTVSRYTFVRFILHIYLILHFCVPRLKFLEPKWSQKHSQTYKAIPCLDKYSSRSLTTIL